MKRLTIALVCALLMAGCVPQKRKNFVLLIDNSTSVPETVILRYVSTAVDALVPRLGQWDRVTVQFVDGCSQNMAERVFNIDLATMDFTNRSDGENRKEDSINARLGRYLTTTLKQNIAEAILAKRKERTGCGAFTDLISAIDEAKKLVDHRKNFSNGTDKLLNEANGEGNFEYENCLVVFSDMINENPERTYDFTGFGRLKTEDVYLKLENLKAENKIPDLAGVKVLVYGATSTKGAGPFAAKQMENTKLFWELFFKSAGADLKGYGYDTRLELENYMASK